MIIVHDELSHQKVTGEKALQLLKDGKKDSLNIGFYIVILKSNGR